MKTGCLTKRTAYRMRLNQKLYDLFADQAADVKIEILSLGLGYTAAVTSDGGIGLAYTYFENKKACMILNKYIDYESRPAVELLAKIKSANSIERSMALALVNALNHRRALGFPEDHHNRILFEEFHIRAGSRVAMVGYFGPLVKMFEEKKAALEILDASRHLGNENAFYEKLGGWAEVLFLTSTSILNNTTEAILSYVHPRLKTVMLGPSTPMVAEAFSHLPVHMLAGTVPIDRENLLKAVRHGMGTPVLQKFGRKSFVLL